MLEGSIYSGRSGSRNCALSWMPRIKANKDSHQGGADVPPVVRESRPVRIGSFEKKAGHAKAGDADEAS